MPPGQLSSANCLRQANATAAGLYRLSNRAFAGSWAMSASSQQERLRRGGAGGVTPPRPLRREKAVDRWGAAPLPVRHGLIDIDGGRPHRRATAVGAGNDLTSGPFGAAVRRAWSTPRLLALGRARRCTPALSAAMELATCRLRLACARPCNPPKR